jgi:hypothetical protein
MQAEEGIVPLLTGVAANTDKPIIGVVDGGRLFDPLRDALLAAGVPIFPVCDRAMAATALYIEARLQAEAIRAGEGV